MSRSRRTYGLPGINNAILYFKTGNASLKVEFKGGSSFGEDRPASFSTADPVIQAIIENDPRFNNGPIRLVAVYPIKETDAPVVKSKEPASIPEAKTKQNIIEDVTDLNGVRYYLKTVIGVSPQGLNGLTAIKNRIAENNLVFPNVVFEE